MDMQLAAKRAFVSGSTQGIGFSIAKALLQEGVSVVINGVLRVGSRARSKN
jgi:NAD(P)-dependent dehydrogenase (short-subunit alcohol dehydrogenase family)